MRVRGIANSLLLQNHGAGRFGTKLAYKFYAYERCMWSLSDMCVSTRARAIMCVCVCVGHNMPRVCMHYFNDTLIDDSPKLGLH